MENVEELLMNWQDCFKFSFYMVISCNIYTARCGDGLVCHDDAWCQLKYFTTFHIKRLPGNSE